MNSEYVASFEDIKESYKVSLEKRIEVAAVCIVHIAGRASKDIFEIKNFCSELNIPLVEDNAQGFLSKIEGEWLGSIGDYSAISFHTTKVIACGEGGLISCKNERDLKIQNNILYGRSDIEPRIFDKVSGNFKLSEMNAALAIADLERSHGRIDRRKYIDKLYRDNVSSRFFSYLEAPTNNIPSYYKTLFIAKNIEIREKIEQFFKQNSIAMTGSVYREPLSVQPRVINSPNYIERKLPFTDKFCSLHFAPPNYPELKDSEIMQVIDVMNSFNV